MGLPGQSPYIMKTIVRKTEEEMRQDAVFTPIKVKDYSGAKYEYWECDLHKVVFEPEDTVLLKRFGNSDRLVCPLRTKYIKFPNSFNLFKPPVTVETVCGEGLMGADKAWYESRYKILPYTR
jgi:hypothetical protein